jgi:hypothetical protein
VVLFRRVPFSFQFTLISSLLFSLDNRSFAYYVERAGIGDGRGETVIPSARDQQHPETVRRIEQPEEPENPFHGRTRNIVHFIRDLGAAFLTLGVAFCVAAPRAVRHRGVVLAAAAFYGLHALIHVSDLATGRLAGHHWLLDLPGVFLPAIFLGVLCAPRWWPKDT